jgi:hypothetical protein
MIYKTTQAITFQNTALFAVTVTTIPDLSRRKRVRDREGEKKT